MDEFALIDKIFRPLAKKGAPAFNLENDTAIYSPPRGFDLVFTKDVLIEAVHFPADSKPDVAARRLLAANLSDLAAAGAKPVGYLLGIMGSANAGENWLRKFAAALGQEQKKFSISLFGGDTTSGSRSLCLSLTAIGIVKAGSGLTRKGARPGDVLFVSGTIGDAYLGLQGILGKAAKNKFLVSRFERPETRVALGQGLIGLATATVDISDGLVADAGHIAEASRLGVEIDLNRVPISKEATRSGAAVKELICAGDDLELAFAVPQQKTGAVKKLSKRLGLPLTEIGRFVKGRGIQVLDQNRQIVDIKKPGYRHYT